MNHHIHTCLVSYNRLHLTRQTIRSYLETVTLPHTLIVVDNASDEATSEWLLYDSREYDYDVLLLPTNRYPGYACNRGWERMPEKTTLLHRSDNDFSYLPGWCDEVVTRFNNPQIGQVGLRTNREEMKVRSNVGGNNVIRRRLWDDGLRYDERPWGKDYPPGWTEDSLFSPEVLKLGYEWTRVKKPCIVSLATGDWNDPYYEQSYSVRGIKQPERTQ
jgi:glycosyltransferase involved in cell wall biosynthesis